MEGRGYDGGRGSGGSSGGRGRGRQGNGGRSRNARGAGGYGRGRNDGGYEQNSQTRYNESGGRRGGGRGYFNRAPQQQSSGGSVVGRGVWTRMQWGPSFPSLSTGQPQNQVGRQPRNQTQRPVPRGCDGAIFCIIIIIIILCVISPEFLHFASRPPKRDVFCLSNLVKAVNNFRDAVIAVIEIIAPGVA